MSVNMAEEPSPESVPASDETLLVRYVNDRDQAAFRELTERHAALVLSVCRRGAPSPADAEDAFQATFIVLAKCAHKVRKPASLAAWLHGVAYRVSVRLRREAACRRMRPLVDSMVTYSDPLDELLARHEQAITDEELAALPESLRTPFVLRYLAEHTNVEVADKLGMSVAAVEGRLKRAKQRLRWRLIRRGVTLTTAVMILKATRVTAGEVPQSLLHATFDVCFGTGAAATAAATTTNASEGATASARAKSTAIQLAHQEVLAMNAFMLSKPLAAAIVAGCVATFAVGVQFSPFHGRTAGAAEQLPLSAGPVVLAAGEMGTNVVANIAFAEAQNSNAAKSATSESGAASTPGSDGPIVEVFDQKQRSAAELKIAVALATVESGFSATHGPTISEMASHFRTSYGISVVIDTVALEDVGLSPEETIKFEAKSISAGAALRNMLRPLALTYIVKDEVLLITTPSVAEEELEFRVYPGDDRGNVQLDAMENIIKSHVLVDTWAEKRVGGNAAITKFSDGLVISQTYEGHEKINELLKQLGWRTGKNLSAR